MAVAMVSVLSALQMAVTMAAAAMDLAGHSQHT
jgi:hypothetical protein